MKLRRSFYERDTLIVAKDLLGKYLVHKIDKELTSGMIVEVEAYIGPEDQASHAFDGLKSKRTYIQYGPGGFSYTYLIYGVYTCFNIVTNVSGKPEVVLIRALEPIEGIDIMKERRRTSNNTNLCNGPGKLCISLGISQEDYGVDLCEDQLYLVDGLNINKSEIIATPRINIDYSGIAKDYLWRFYIKDNKYVSKNK